MDVHGVNPAQHVGWIAEIANVEMGGRQYQALVLKAGCCLRLL